MTCLAHGHPARACQRGMVCTPHDPTPLVRPAPWATHNTVAICAADGHCVWSDVWVFREGTPHDYVCAHTTMVRPPQPPLMALQTG